MSIFDNITFINEGQQAEEYKARKAKEAEDKEKAEDSRMNRRYLDRNAFYGIPGNKTLLDSDGNRYKGSGDRINYNRTINDGNRARKVDDTMDKEYDRRRENVSKAEDEYYDHKKSKKPNPIFRYKDRMEYDKKTHELSKKLSDADKDYERMSGDASLINRDALNRHIRRHPDQYKESSIFESIELL